MVVTSHFIGIEINIKEIKSTLKTLNKYIISHNLAKHITTQNQKSIHITLYYLPKKINIKKVTTVIKNINITDKVKLSGIDYFYNKVLFLKVEESSLKEANKIIHSILKESLVLENSYTYIPHITLLKILDSEGFKKHRKNIDEIISQGISEILNNKIKHSGIYLYKVDSSGENEIQEKITTL